MVQVKKLCTIEWNRPDRPPGDDVLTLYCEIFATEDTALNLELNTRPDSLELLLLPEEARERLDREHFRGERQMLIFRMRPSPYLEDLIESIQRGRVACILFNSTTGGDDLVIILANTPQTDLNVSFGAVPIDYMSFFMEFQDLIDIELRRWENRFRRVA